MLVEILEDNMPKATISHKNAFSQMWGLLEPCTDKMWLFSAHMKDRMQEGSRDYLSKLRFLGLSSPSACYLSKTAKNIQ